jgi:hypothetical protein
LKRQCRESQSAGCESERRHRLFWWALSLPHNVERNRVATVGVDFRFGVNRHSGSRCCSAAFVACDSALNRKDQQHSGGRENIATNLTISEIRTEPNCEEDARRNRQYAENDSGTS